MEIIIEKVVEFGNYLLTINNDTNKVVFINGNLINAPPAYKLFFVKNVSPQNDADDNSTDPEHIMYSQIYEWVNTFGLEDKPENRAAILVYINYFISVQSSINI